MSDMPTLANGGAPASPAPSPQAAPAPASTAPPSPKPSAPENPRARGYSPARDTYEQIRHAQDQGKAPASDQPAPPPSADEQQPAAQGKVRVGAYEVSPEELSAMMQRQASDDLKKATLPASAEAYKAELPADLKLPGGQQFKVDVNDPSFIAARNLAFAKGWSQQDLSEALGIFASHLAGQEFRLAERSRAEIAKAGANAPQRVDAVTRWIRGEVGDVEAKPIISTIVTDAHLRFYERMMQKDEQHIGFSQKHRVAPDADSRIPGYENMSFEQRRFAQDQAAARRGR
jgi:transcriptional regulator with XRE-family HTH domain